MNRIYRRVWSTALQCWVVASELAARKGKAGRAASATGLTVLLSMLAPDAMATELTAQEDARDEKVVQEWAVRAALGLPPALILSTPRMVAPFAGPAPVRQLALTTDAAYADSTVNGNHLVVLGSRSSLTGNFSVGYGNLITTRGDSIVAIGYNVKATNGGYNTAVGTNAIASGVGATVYGNGAQAYSENSVAMGSGAVAHDGAGIAKIAIGGDAYAGSSGWTGAIAMGGKSRAQYDGVAIGYEASTSANGTVALGRGSVASVANTVSVGNATTKRRIVNVANGDVNTTSTDAVNGRQLNAVSVDARTALSTANTAKSTADRALAASGLVSQTSASGAIRVGGANSGTVIDVANQNGAKRRIQNIGNGVLSTTSTDAVTGSQLHATNSAVTTAQNAATGAQTAAAAAQAGVDAVGNRLSASALALGADAVAETNAFGISTALGQGARSYNGQSVALGFDARAGVDKDGNKVANANAGVSVGSKSRSGNGGVAMGLQAQAEGDRAVAVGNDAKSNALHASAIGYRSEASGEKAAALGADARATGQYATATGHNTRATGERALASGVNAQAAGANSSALGSGAKATHSNSVALGAGSVSYSDNSVSVGNASTRRKLQYVADGAVGAGSTDAVTGSQLHATNTNVSAAQSAATTAQTAATAAQQTADGVVSRATALEGLVSQVSASGSLRLGAQNTGTVLDVRNKSNAVRKLSGLADGTLSATSTEAVTGKQLNVTNTNVTAAQNAAATAQTAATAAQRTADGVVTRATALEGLVSQVSVSGSLRLGAENTGTTLDLRNKSNAARKLSGLADGSLSNSSSEAVTGKQLFATQQKVIANEGVLATHSSQLSGQDGRIVDNRRDLDELRTEFDNFDPDLEGVVKFAADGGIDLNGGKVRGVAAGDISSAGSTEAVNGGQLFATNRRIDVLSENAKYLAFGEFLDQEAAMAGRLAIALGDSAQASITPNSEGAVALGAYAIAEGTSSVALGRASHVHEEAARGFALGAESQVAEAGGVALGAASSVLKGAAESVAIGAQSVAKEAHTVSFGNDVLKRRLANVARGLGEHDATTVAQLSESLETLGGGAMLDASGNIIAPSYNVQGETFNTVGQALSSLDGAVLTAGTRVERVENQLRSVFQESPATRSDGLNQLNLAGPNGMVLGNVANGLIAPGSRDAVNGGQLHAVKQDIAENRTALDELRMGDRALNDLSDGRTSTLVGAVDFGGSTVTGVADGVIANGSRDVVNGSQLFSTNARLGELEAGSRYVAVWADGESEAAQAGKMGVAIGDGSFTSSSEGGTAIGSYTSAQARDSVALGRGANVGSSGDRGFAALVGSNVYSVDGIALGAYSRVEAGAQGSLALGAFSIAREAGVVSFGHSNLQRRLINVADGRNPSDAATVSQLNKALSTFGGGASIDTAGNVVGPMFAVQGSAQHTVSDALTALDNAVITNGTRVDRVENQLRSVFQDSPATRRDGLNQLNLAGPNGMVLGNVANGLIAPGSRDAVNGGQLHAMEQRLDGRIDGLEQRVVAQPEGRALAAANAPTPPAAADGEGPASASGDPAAASADRAGGNIASADGGGKPAAADAPPPSPQVDTAELEKMLARANEYTDGAIRGVEQRLDKMDKRFNRMAAMSSAQTAMAMNTAGLATYNRLGAGVGYAEGESAMAVGYQRVLNERGSATFSLNGAFTNSGEQSVGLGVGIGW